MAEIKLVVSEEEEHLGLQAEDNTEQIKMEPKGVVEVITSDYRKLNNLPSINGERLVDNYNEIDPTVPVWAKRDEPEEMSYSDIYELWQSVF